MPKLSALSPDDIYKIVAAKAVFLHPGGSVGAVLLRQARDDQSYTNRLLFLEGLVGDGPRTRSCPLDALVDLCWSLDGRLFCWVQQRDNGHALAIGSWNGPTSIETPDQILHVETRPRSLSWNRQGTRLTFALRVPHAAGSIGSVSTEPGRRIISGIVPFKAESSGYWQGGFHQLFLIERDASGTWTRRQLTNHAYDHLMPSLAPDGTQVVYVRPAPGPDRHYGNEALAALDLATLNERILVEPNGPCAFPTWSPDGRQVAWLSHDGHMGIGEATDLRVWVYRDGTAVQIPTGIDRSIEDMILDDCTHVDGTGARPITWEDDDIVCLITDGAATGLYRRSIGEHGTAPLHPLLDGPRRVFAYAHAAGRVVAGVASPDDPCRVVDVFGGIERVLFAPNQEWLGERRLSIPQYWPVEGARGATLDGWITPPLDAPLDGAPCVMLINRGRFGWSFYFEAQVLAGHGFAVAYLNPHGSYGYGEIFRGATHYDPGTVEVEDFVKGIEALPGLGIDRRRIGVSGASFGGFMVNWLLTQYPDRIAAAVTQASYCNRHSLWGTSSIGPSRWDRPGPPWEHAEFLLARSPLSYVNRVTAPVLLIHGDRDTICPLEQAEQWFTALTVLGKEPVWMILEGEGHDLAREARPASRIARLTAIAEWFERHLLRRAAQPSR